MQLLAFEVSGSESVLSVNGRIEGVGDNFNVWLVMISVFTSKLSGQIFSFATRECKRAAHLHGPVAHLHPGPVCWRQTSPLRHTEQASRPLGFRLSTVRSAKQQQEDSNFLPDTPPSHHLPAAGNQPQCRQTTLVFVDGREQNRKLTT